MKPENRIPLLAGSDFRDTLEKLCHLRAEKTATDIFAELKLQPF